MSVFFLFFLVHCSTYGEARAVAANVLQTTVADRRAWKRVQTVDLNILDA